MGNHRPQATIGRHSLSHALAGVPAPSEREPGELRRRFQLPQRGSLEREGKRKYWYTPRATTTVDIDTRGKAG